MLLVFGESISSGWMGWKPKLGSTLGVRASETTGPSHVERAFAHSRYFGVQID